MATAADTRPEDDLEAFRGEVQTFLAENFPPSLKGKSNAMRSVEGPGDETPEEEAWRKAMGERGWGTPT